MISSFQMLPEAEKQFHVYGSPGIMHLLHRHVNIGLTIADQITNTSKVQVRSAVTPRHRQNPCTNQAEQVTDSPCPLLAARFAPRPELASVDRMDQGSTDCNRPVWSRMAVASV